MEEKEAYRIEKAQFAIDNFAEYLMARREVLCQELAQVERQLDKMGKPVKRPRMGEK